MSSSVEPEDLPLKERSRSGGALSGFRDAILSGLRSPFATQTGPGEAEHCLRRVLPLCRRARITRVADLTGLDRIGLPVVQVVRPAALSEVTSLGRGLAMSEAALGAIMESLERFFAESVPAERVFLASADDIGLAEGLFEQLLAPGVGSNWRTREIHWITGIDIATGAAEPVPLELVHTRYTEPPPARDGLFIRTTTGLACHTSAYGAFLHGLFECIERDAMARAFATHGFFDRMRIAPSGLGDRVDRIGSVAGECGVSFGLWLAPSPTGVPVVWCQAIETGPGEPILALPTEGYAAGPSVAAAAASAMLEALSARAGAISGARDDQTRGHYRRSMDAVVSQARQLIVERASTARYVSGEVPIVDDLAALIEKTMAARVGPILAVPVGSDCETGVHCVRVILPGATPFSILR
ncbi:YcaO-like family protein [Sinorhizobium terangae]|uniref:YcaO-like family protein n=1 Tax=Sinorhizobium terangae TaxID=110322 RepID=UPI00142EF096|nr:YcaO-like family protein [Sinorhizobium terangae]MBB4185597.1 YcaO-like protein with predicted kinase domain [Sinorhizobium terangae]WFU46339.1 YcaO-like family protein [Sinorhizobium terangae]